MYDYQTLTKNVLRHTLRVGPGENVIVEAWNHGLPIAAEFVFQIRAMGAQPLLLFEDEETFWRSAAVLPMTRHGKVGGHEWAALETADAYVFVSGPSDISRIPQVGIDRYDAMMAYADEWYERAANSRIRGAQIDLGYVTESRARTYGFDLHAWRQMMLEASSVEPRELRRAGAGIQRMLSRKGHVEISAPNGTRFEVDLGGRHAHLEDGVVTPQALIKGENMASIPAGEVYVAPRERTGAGTIRFDRPIASVGRWAREIVRRAWLPGLTFAFDDGRAKWSCEQNAELVLPGWKRAKEGRDLLAGIGIGLNPKAQTGYLQDDLVAGNAYVAIGDSGEFGGRNFVDFGLAGTLTGATVTVDGTTLIEQGRIV